MMIEISKATATVTMNPKIVMTIFGERKNLRAVLIFNMPFSEANILFAVILLQSAYDIIVEKINIFDAVHNGW